MQEHPLVAKAIVAPCAGAWVEMIPLVPSARTTRVAPCAGAWVEMAIRSGPMAMQAIPVAPCAGAWVEIALDKEENKMEESPPVRGRGLKFSSHQDWTSGTRRPLCGGVG